MVLNFEKTHDLILELIYQDLNELLYLISDSEGIIWRHPASNLKSNMISKIIIKKKVVYNDE
jgi:hypothetical protein